MRLWQEPPEMPACAGMTNMGALLTFYFRAARFFAGITS